MPINFPSGPSSGQLYSYDNKTWEWNGTYWEVYSALTSYVGGTGTTNTIPKWSGVNSLTDSQIYESGGFVGIGTSVQTYQEVLSVQGGDGGIVNNSFNFVGHSSTSIAIADANYRTWGSSGAEIAIGSGQPLLNSTGANNIAIGSGALQTNTTGVDNIGIGFSSLLNNQAGQGNVSLGYEAGANITSGSFNVLLGYQAGYDLTIEDNKLYISNGKFNNLIYGEFDNGIVNIDGTLSATTYDNLPGSSSANCFTTFYVTNISGCSPVNMLSPLNVQDGINVTGTSTFTSQVNFTGGLSANTFSASTYQNLPTDVFVSAGTYSNGQITFTNTTGGTFNVSNIPIGGAGGQPYYFNLSVSQTPYQQFGPSATTASEQTKSVTIASGVTSTFEGFLTPPGYPNVTLIPAGFWSFYLHAYKAASTTTFDIFCEVYRRTTGGTETLLLLTDPVEVTAIGSPSMVISDGYYSGASINSSDRIVVKVRTTNTGTASSTVTFVTEGTIHYSYGVTPFTNSGNVLGVTATDGLSGNSSTGNITIINTDKGSSQNIFKNIQVGGVTQFSAGSNSSNLNFSGINITITSAATNTLVFSAGTGGDSGNFLPTSGGTITGNLIVTGNTNVSGTTTSTGNVISLQNLQSLYSVGNEGGEITLAKPATNSTISGTSVTIDIFQNRLRFFESGSPNRGAYIDITAAASGVGSNLLSGGTGGGTALGTVYTTANNFNFL